jgi:LysR family transcriptional activator of nhaA
MINYKHLHYFRVVAKESGISRASERLHLTPQIISGQLSLLEEGLGEDLFTCVGRNLKLTETGRLVLSYAVEIFSLGGELEEIVCNLPVRRPIVYKVGVKSHMKIFYIFRLPRMTEKRLYMSNAILHSFISQGTKLYKA